MQIKSKIHNPPKITEIAKLNSRGKNMQIKSKIHNPPKITEIAKLKSQVRTSSSGRTELVST